jgi:cysteinyl-tRNA synthetase
VSLELHNSLTGRREPFTPLKPGRAGIYLCGPTVDGGPHIGHARSAVLFDVLGRYLEAQGFGVTLVRNVTDIDDKIIAAARREGCDCRALADRNAARHRRALERLGVRPPACEPRPSEFIAAIRDAVARLIQSGHAYPSGGDVYFAVASFPGYGRLSGRTPAAGPPAGEGGGAEGNGKKRDPADFALWKAAREDEPAWPSPWGPGRPGWHIECSVMSTALLGETFDIHGGGIDLLFPHHENEIAQSQSLSGKPPAAAWLHHGLVCRRGEKMAKSTGNALDLEEALAACPPGALRLFLLSKRYRHPLEFSAEGLRQAENAYARLARFLSAYVAPNGKAERRGGLWRAFCAAMDADLNTPLAVARLFQALREENRAAAHPGGTAPEAARERAADLFFICREILGLEAGGGEGRQSPTPQRRNP